MLFKLNDGATSGLKRMAHSHCERVRSVIPLVARPRTVIPLVARGPGAQTSEEPAADRSAQISVVGRLRDRHRAERDPAGRRVVRRGVREVDGTCTEVLTGSTTCVEVCCVWGCWVEVCGAWCVRGVRGVYVLCASMCVVSRCVECVWSV